MNRRPGQLVADVGGGRARHFAVHRDEYSSARIVAVDISSEELRHNPDVDEARVADVTRGLPFPEREVDLIAARTVLEHLPDVESFVVPARAALKDGGYLISLFPSRLAPFALLNRVLPNAVSRTLLHVLIPGSKDGLGFPAFYDRGSPSAMASLLKSRGFRVVDVQVSYYGASYFSFFANCSR